MDWFIDILTRYGPVGYVFASAGLALFMWFVWGQLRVHEAECQEFRREMRNVDTDIRRDIADLRTDVVRVDGKIDTVVAVLKRVEANGNGQKCGGKGKVARKKRSQHKRVHKAASRGKA